MAAPVTTISVRTTTRSILLRLARENRRTLIGELEVLVEEEAQRRGINLDDAAGEPVSAHANGKHRKNVS